MLQYYSSKAENLLTVPHAYAPGPNNETLRHENGKVRKTCVRHTDNSVLSVNGSLSLTMKFQETTSQHGKQWRNSSKPGKPDL